jgi:hypothetical protein
MWVAGPDLIASVLLSGRVPHIQEAFRIVPNGKQRGLRSTKLRGVIAIDPGRRIFSDESSNTASRTRLMIDCNIFLKF